MQARLANLNDLDQICSLYRQMYFEVAALQPENYVAVEPMREMISRNIQDESGGMIVVLGDTQMIIGFIYIKEHKDTTTNRSVGKYALIEAYFMRRNDRRNETAQILIDEAISWARSRSLKQIVISVLAENGFGTGAFENAEFSTVAKVMCKAL